MKKKHYLSGKLEAPVQLASRGRRFQGRTSPALPTVLLASCLIALGLTPGFAALTVSPDIGYYFGEGPGEGLSVSSDGHIILVSSPIALPALAFNSLVPQLLHLPRTPQQFFELNTLELGFGEVTDVAVVPNAFYGLAVVRGDSVNTSHALLAIFGDHVLQRLPIPQSPDGMKVTPDGRYAIVAVEKGGEIRIYDLSRGAGRIQLAALVSRAAIAARFVGVLNPVADAEPEAVGISSDSSFALVTLQDCASVVAIDLGEVRRGQRHGSTPEAIGNGALKNVVHLPFGFVGNNGALFGVEPDGVAISPNGTFAMLAHEANQRAKHLQGFSVLDLRRGLGHITAQTYSVFDLDPSLLANTGLAACPIVAPGDPYPSAADKLPRLDPASFKIVRRGPTTVAAFVIERYDPSSAQTAASPNNESRGSVLFLEAGRALHGDLNIIDRVPVGATGARVEVIDSSNHGRWFYVSISNGGAGNATIARLELLGDDQEDDD